MGLIGLRRNFGLQPRRGFTLIEVLIVLLISSIVLVVLATVLASSFEILRTGETRAALNASARNALNYLVEDISTASYIPRMEDRDLNGYDDGESLPADGGNGYDLAATWTVGREINNIIVVDASYFLSEAFSDHIMTMHDNRAWSVLGNMVNQAHDPPKVIAGVGGTNAISYRSFFRLVVPASAEFPYLLAGEHDRDNNGSITPGELLNTGSSAGQIYGYPDVVPVGNHKETAVLIQDLFYRLIDKDTNAEEPFVRRVRQLPIASDITRINFSYYHSVPVYQSRVNGGSLEIAYQDITTGELRWAAPDSQLNSSTTYNCVALLARWELRQIDVAFDTPTVDPGGTGAIYGGTHYSLADMYPEGYDNRKLDGTNTSVGNHIGLQFWNCDTFYNTDSNGDQVSDNAPVDRFAFVTTGLDANGNPMEGGTAALRHDFQPILGSVYYQGSINPTGIGDFGDADGIPDGDGVPDDPVPGWWLPYLRAVRVSVTATPRAIIEERRNMSGKPGRDGTVLFYRLDSPIPYVDANRITPAQERKRDYIGMGKDLVLTKMVPVKYSYQLDLVTDPLQYRQLWAQLTGSPNPQGGFARRVEWNFINSAQIMSSDPYDPGATIKARDAAEKYLEKKP
jgi:prepilin-type N-terminal cleavage/methylation domain-containing protein